MAASDTANIAHVSRLDSSKYQQTLEANATQSVRNIPTLNYFKKCKLKLLDWPSRYLEWNIIENVCVDIKDAVHARWPENIPKLEGRVGRNSLKKNRKTLSCLQKNMYTSADEV